ncbi:NAD(P)H-binding protein [Actinocorallia aurantiaca]|uniref:NmrA family NAD(P)-binding protein n=1 Tax=Actinocorallia aurantiaca TaxID=46204 RepID=A0ABP6GQI9_9ACTN
MFLVTGAAGGVQGSTGRLVAEALLAQEQPVRAFVRRDDERAARLRELGAEIHVGDLREINDVRPALVGVRRAFFTYPVTGGLLDATVVFAAAAREENVERVVEVSQLDARIEARTPRMRQHWLSEQVFDWAGVGAVHLRAAVFHENLTVLAALSGWRELAVPLGPPSTRVPLIAAEDVARVAVALLLSPGAVEPVVHLTGQMLSVGEVAEVLREVCGLSLEYVDADPGQWRRDLLAVLGDPHTVEHLSALWEIFRTTPEHPLYRVTEAIERLGGRPPVTYREFLAHRSGPAET